MQYPLSSNISCGLYHFCYPVLALANLAQTLPTIKSSETVKSN